MKNEVSKELKKQKRFITYQKFLVYLLSIYSILNGLYIIHQQDFWVEALDVYLYGLDNNIFGFALIFAGTMKLLGTAVDSGGLKRLSIVLLSVTWGMLCYTAVWWSFGLGYPNDSFLSTSLMLIICWRVSYKGEFD